MRFSGFAIEHDAVHVDAGQVHRIRIDAAGLDDLLDLDHRHLAGHRARRIEVARGAAEHQVAALVGLPRLHQRHIGHQRALHHVGLAVELARLLAFGDHRADAGAGEEGRDAGAAGAQLLGQRALRREFELEFAGQILALELLVLADVARDHLLDLARLEQQAEAEAVDAGVVRDDGQVLDPAVAQRVDQRLGYAAQAEAADRQQLVVAHQAVERRSGARIELFHLVVPRDPAARPLRAATPASVMRNRLRRHYVELTKGSPRKPLTSPTRFRRSPITASPSTRRRSAWSSRASG